MGVLIGDREEWLLSITLTSMRGEEGKNKF